MSESPDKQTRVLVVHGPNLNLLGDRENSLYGDASLADIDNALAGLAAELGVGWRAFSPTARGRLYRPFRTREVLTPDCLSTRLHTRIPAWQSATR